jgi:hypothetical protein
LSKPSLGKTHKNTKKQKDWGCVPSDGVHETLSPSPSNKKKKAEVSKTFRSIQVPVILAIQEAEIWRIAVQGQLRQNESKTLS